MSEGPELTILLRRASAGDRDAETELISYVYRDLRNLAATFLHRERRDHTLQPTALVHEVYVRLFGISEVQWQDRSHFFRMAATAMRRILVDHARNRKATKRGGDQVRMPLDDVWASVEGSNETIVDLDRALGVLTQIDERQASVVEMRFFGGLSEEEIGDILKISPRTVKREWAMAKAWLLDELRPRRDL